MLRSATPPPHQHPNPEVRFLVNSSLAPRGHITGTSCLPDLAAYTSPPRDSYDWVNLEAVVAYHSLKSTDVENIKQVVAYTGYLLFARPDRVAMLGLYIHEKKYAIVLMDPTGTYYSHTLPLNPDNISLLRRALRSINTPPELMVDPTIRREIRAEGTTFNITTGSKSYSGCRQQWSPTLGHWTTIFTTGDRTVPVIKEQFLRPNNASQITEAKILQKIHSRGEMPGVVRVGWYGLVKREDGSCVECGRKESRRQKVRLELKDEGDPFMTIETPYDALLVIWDLLEGDAFTSTQISPLTCRVSNAVPLQREVSPPSRH